MGHDDCLKTAEKQFKVWLNDRTQRPHPDVRSIVYKYGMRVNANEATWETVWNLYLDEADAEEKLKLMFSLAQSQNPQTLKRYLMQANTFAATLTEFTIFLRSFVRLAGDEKNVRGQDYFSCLTSISANPIGESIIWDYVRENWLRFVDRFGLNERYLGRLIPSITSRFSTGTKLDEVKSFFARHPEAGAGAAARNETLQNIENNIEWLKNNEQKVVAWLEKQPPIIAADEPTAVEDTV